MDTLVTILKALLFFEVHGLVGSFLEQAAIFFLNEVPDREPQFSSELRTCCCTMAQIHTIVQKSNRNFAPYQVWPFQNRTFIDQNICSFTQLVFKSGLYSREGYIASMVFII